MKEQFLVDKISKMSLQNKLGQMIFMDFRKDGAIWYEMNSDLEEVLTKYAPGGFIIFNENLSTLKIHKNYFVKLKNLGI